VFDASDYWITIVELGNFRKSVDGLLSDEEVEGLIAYLSKHPDEGAIMPDTGGVRKLRWATQGRGKRGGARIIYYFRDLNMPLYLLTAYGKGEKINLKQREKADMRKIVEALVKRHWGNQVAPRVNGQTKPIA
jgi:hypothetical protein